MDIKEAEKLAKQKTEQNYFSFHLDHGTKLIVPAKAGMMIVEALADAEIMVDSYGDRHGLKYLSAEDFGYMQCKAFSAQEYRKLKMAQLLDIDIRDLDAKVAGEPLCHTT